MNTTVMNNKILIIDDDIDICLMLQRLLTDANMEVTISGLGIKSMELIKKTLPDVVLCDYRLPDTNGSILLALIKTEYPSLPVIFISACSEIRIAVDLMRQGAFDYLAKPLHTGEIMAAIRKAIDCSGIQLQPIRDTPGEEKNKQPPVTKIKTSTAGYIFGNSPLFKEIIKQIGLVAPTNYSVIISGESGSGKEAIANEIHQRSNRKHMPFIAIDCGALTNELAASELFGNEKGSFTGAANQKTGSLELANGGTVFLDEIGNLAADTQAALLRIVQERKLRRVGGIKDIELDIRIIVAGNDRLEVAAKEGRFREDLFHRFNEFSIQVPPLRKRQNDIMLFANFFLQQCNDELEKDVKGFASPVEVIFKGYRWPGNLRELKNTVKRATLLAEGEYIEAGTLPAGLLHNKTDDYKAETPGMFNSATKPIPPDTKGTSTTLISDLKNVSIGAEFELIVAALKKSNYNKSKAARLLNVDRKTLYNKMKQYHEYHPRQV